MVELAPGWITRRPGTSEKTPRGDTNAFEQTSNLSGECNGVVVIAMDAKRLDFASVQKIDRLSVDLCRIGQHRAGIGSAEEQARFIVSPIHKPFRDKTHPSAPSDLCNDSFRLSDDG